ncbi:uncharacterized protein LOC144453298 [Glandiceps talaboti]
MYFTGKSTLQKKRKADEAFASELPLANSMSSAPPLANKHYKPYDYLAYIELRQSVLRQFNPENIPFHQYATVMMVLDDMKETCKIKTPLGISVVGMAKVLRHIKSGNDDGRLVWKFTNVLAVWAPFFNLAFEKLQELNADLFEQLVKLLPHGKELPSVDQIIAIRNQVENSEEYIQDFLYFVELLAEVMHQQSTQPLSTSD